MPAVAQFGCALDGARARAANPHRQWALDRLGRETQVIEVPVRTTDGRHVRGPELAHDAHHLVGNCATVMEVEPQRVRLLARATGADTQNEAPARELIERRRILR